MKLNDIRSILALTFALTFNAKGVTHYVDLNSTNPVAPYTTWATAATYIQQAVNFIVPGDVVLVTNGVYRVGGASGSRVSVFSSALVRSVNGPAVTVIEGYQVPGTTNGPGAIRCVVLASGAMLSGFTLTNGATSNDAGGGVKCASTSCVVSNCVFIGNAASGGGGVYSGTIFNCALIRNSGGGGSGGGAENSVLVNCTLIGNVSGYRGGGAENGSLTNCVLIGNSADNYGGGTDSSTLVNCTVVSNTAKYYGGGVEGGTVENSIVYYNNLVVGSAGNTNYHSTSSITNCCTTPLPAFGANNIADPPLFANLATNNLHLNAASPCVNSGNNSFITSATDLDGNVRIIAGTVDIGAYEFQSPIHYVRLNNFAPVSPYTNWATAATNIQDAIDVAIAGEFVVVSNGIYQTGGRAVYGTASNRIVLDKALTVQSVNGAASTIIAGVYTAPTHGGPNIRCAYLTNGAVLNGFTLTNGGTPTVLGDLTREASGAGVWCESVGASISNCVIVGNTSGYGGGGAYSGTLTSCTLSSNAVIGGRGWGGGAWMSMLNNCVLFRNNGYEGGGAMSSKLGNCLLVGNSAGYGGGAFSSILINCTVVSNSATYSGGGLSGGSADSFSTNCIVYYNAAPTGPNWSGGNLGYDCTTPLPVGAGNITNAPFFVSAATMNFRLQSNSPCINSGNGSSVSAITDLDGNLRITGDTVDMGAYEFQSPSSVLSYAWAQQFGLPTDGSADFADGDGDGLNNWQEWIAGTDPTNSASVLLLGSPSNAVSGVTITWQSVSGKIYFVERATDFSAQPAFSAIQSNILGQAGSTTYADSSANGGGPFFYRVGVQQ